MEFEQAYILVEKSLTMYWERQCAISTGRVESEVNGDLRNIADNHADIQRNILFSQLKNLKDGKAKGTIHTTQQLTEFLENMKNVSEKTACGMKVGLHLLSATIVTSSYGIGDDAIEIVNSLLEKIKEPVSKLSVSM